MLVLVIDSSAQTGKIDYEPEHEYYSNFSAAIASITRWLRRG